MADSKQPEQTPTFEQAIARLSDVVRELEDGNLSLDESLSRYEEGIRCLGQCRKILSSAERKIEILSGFDADGSPITQHFDDDEMTLPQKADQRSRRRTARRTENGPASESTVTTTGDEQPDNPTSVTRSPQNDVDSGGRLF